METKSTLSEEVKKILDKNLELRGLRKTPSNIII